MLEPAKEAFAFRFEELSMMNKHNAKWNKEESRCWALLETLGADSPKWRELNAGNAPQSARAVQSDVFKIGSKTEQVAQNRREVEVLLLWMNCSRIPWSSPTPLQMAAFLRDRKSQSASAPARAFRGMKWLERVSGPQFHGSDSTVISQAVPPKQGEKPDAEPALTPTMDMLKAMADSVWSAPTGVLRCIAGFVCVLAWGVVRFHDAQHVNLFTLTKDSLLL